ncbi:hypothetical protein TcasGA2_TC010703 [Tribolium castaneum]|uniref:DNA-directed DNA polymerase n=1 Tax=Tribolium castaneum TaxID=7070 RepID=D2CG27_TRICA|nr:hypothetical protein TcasGA2_TC010703 [Tribolium castaneum]
MIESLEDLILARDVIIDHIVIDGENLEEGWEIELFEMLIQNINYKSQSDIYVGHAEYMNVDLDRVDGFIKCRILPPQNLYHPVLPYKCNGKLTFPLCKLCVETSYQNVCSHSNDERSFIGTFVADELRKSLELGYRILELKEIWSYRTRQYDRKSESSCLFSQYVNTFLKIKQECCGWPVWCVSEEDKEKYFKEYREKEGITLERNKICKNPGLRFLSKFMLNSFWGKFGQRENLQKTSIVSQPKDLYDILSNPSLVVNSITIINPDVLLVTYEQVEEAITPLRTVSVPIAAYTTSSARLELYKYLEQLGRRVLYFDTDSDFFTQMDGEWEPPTGDFLGDLTDEMTDYGPDSYFSEFVSAGPKNYAFKFWSSNKQEFSTVCKVMGITLHYKNAEKVKFDVMKSMICNGNDDDSDNDDNDEGVIVLTDRIIVRNVRYDVMSRISTKKYGINYTKCRRLNDSYDTLPYGYVE